MQIGLLNGLRSATTIDFILSPCYAQCGCLIRRNAS